MALLVTGNFYTVTFLPTTDGAWAALSPAFPGGINGNLAAAVYLATPAPIDIYVIDASSGLFAFEGGQGYSFDDTLVDGAPAAGTTFTLDAVDSSQSIWCLNAGGDLYAYDSSAGILRAFSGAEATAFKAFLP